MLLAGVVLAFCTGCSGPRTGPVVFYCEGAGWYSSSGSVRSGLEAAGYAGVFRNYSWSSHLGAATDHLFAARSQSRARGLAEKILRARKEDPTSSIYVMGLSAGSAIVLSALEQLKGGAMVDGVVLFAPSVSAHHNLTRAMRTVKGRLYCTCSPHDGILRGLAVNADGLAGPPAGRTGFRLPRNLTEAGRGAYSRVVNLPWQASYIAYDYHGGHTSSTNSRFVEVVIAPRVLGKEPHPLDRSLLDRVGALVAGDGS